MKIFRYVVLLGIVLFLASCGIEKNAFQESQKVIPEVSESVLEEGESEVNLGEEEFTTVDLNGKTITLGSDITLQTILNNEDLSFINTYEHTNFEDINFANVVLTRLQEVSNIQEYKNFVYSVGSDDYLFLLIAKKSDATLWRQLLGYVFESYYTQEGTQFIERIGLNATNKTEQKLEFLEMTNDSFIQLPLSSVPSISSEDGDDVGEFANTGSMQENIIYCDTKYPIGEIENNICKDKSYFYKASIDNGYCSEIQDPYLQRLCNDFLKI